MQSIWFTNSGKGWNAGCSVTGDIFLTSSMHVPFVICFYQLLPNIRWPGVVKVWKLRAWLLRGCSVQLSFHVALEQISMFIPLLGCCSGAQPRFHVSVQQQGKDLAHFRTLEAGYICSKTVIPRLHSQVTFCLQKRGQRRLLLLKLIQEKWNRLTKAMQHHHVC